MVDVIRETPLDLKRVAQRFGVTVKTVRCWSRGVGGRRLETARLGGKVFTTLEAIQRFTCQHEEPEYAPSLTDLQKDHEEASRLLLAKHG